MTRNYSGEVNRCIHCGRQLRTGYKYCWKHRGMRKQEEIQPMYLGLKGIIITSSVIFVILLIIVIILMQSSMNPYISENSEEALNQCKQAFLLDKVFNFKRMAYIQNDSDLYNWIISNNFQYQKQEIIIGNFVKASKYPLVLTFGTKKEDRVNIDGYFKCDNKGISGFRFIH